MASTCTSYYKRFFAAFWSDLFRLGKGQVIGFLLALATTILQIIFGLIPKNGSARAIAVFALPYIILLIALIVAAWIKAPVTLDDARRQRAVDLGKAKASETAKLKGEIESLNESAQREARLKAKKFSFWLRVEKEKKLGTIMQYSGNKGTLQADVPLVSLVVLNEGKETLKILGFSLESEKTGITEECNHLVGVAPNQETSLDAIETLMGCISGPRPWDFTSIRRVHPIFVRVRYQDGEAENYSQPVKCFTDIDLTGNGHFKFDITSALPRH